MGRVEINTRVINKHDTEANWNSHPSFIPDKSEIIVYDKDDNYNYPRVKIGDGVTNVVALPFIVNAAVQDIGSLTIDLNSAESGTVPFTNSDMLGGLPPSSYLQVADFPQALTDAGVVKSVVGKTPNASGEVALVPADIGAVPTSRTVNGKALSSNISLTYSDVGAAAASHTHTDINSEVASVAVRNEINFPGINIHGRASGETMNTYKGSIRLDLNTVRNGYPDIQQVNTAGNEAVIVLTMNNLNFSLNGTTLTITKNY